ncbi:MAG: hypothetical protein JNK81_09785 [Anaerolineales bacterium]|nr:hypothetical protein [Anaerolineales bacterium]
MTTFKQIRPFCAYALYKASSLYQNKFGGISMKKMQDFREWLFIPSKDSTNVQQHLLNLANFSPKQFKSLVAFEPWFIWGENEIATQA